MIFWLVWDEVRCSTSMYDDWYDNNIISDDEKELMSRYERPDNEVCCVYIVYLSIIYVTCLLTYLDIILQWTYKVENESDTACLNVLFNKFKCKHCNLLVTITKTTIRNEAQYHRYSKAAMINHATSCKRILGTQQSSVVECQGCLKTLLEIQNEYKYKNHDLLRSWEKHTSNCEGTHYDKVHEAFVAVFGDDVGVNKRGHKNNGTVVTLDLTKYIMVRHEWTNKITLDANLCSPLYNYIARLKENGSKNKKQKVEKVYDDDDDEEEENEDMIIDIDEIELDEGDPPWRTNGHEYISRSIRYNNKIGKVVGWISDTDVDSEGNPGFVGSTGEAACLFHAIFRDFRQDFEEWELIECLI
jgi:hypothetical protein